MSISFKTVIGVFVVLAIIGLAYGKHHLGWDLPVFFPTPTPTPTATPTVTPTPETTATPMLGSKPVLEWVWDGAAFISEHHELDGHHAWVVRVRDHTPASAVEWLRLLQQLAVASKLQPQHGLYVHFLVIDTEKGEYVGLTVAMDYAGAIALLLPAMGDEEAKILLQTHTVGLPAEYYTNLDLWPGWKCEPEDSFCTQLYSWAAADVAGHVWADSLQPVTTQDSE